MLKLNTQVLRYSKYSPRYSSTAWGTQIFEYSMWYCLKYLYLKYFLEVKGLGSPKFPYMSHTPPSVKHVPMLSEVVAGIWGQKDRNRALYIGVSSTQARCTAQHSKWGVHTLSPWVLPQCKG